MLADDFLHHPVGGQITPGGNLPADIGILPVVEIMTVGVKNAVPPKAERLMHLKVKTNTGH